MSGAQWLHSGWAVVYLLGCPLAALGTGAWLAWRDQQSEKLCGPDLTEKCQSWLDQYMNNTATATTAFVATDDSRDNIRIHRAGCSDIARRGERIIGSGATIEAAAIDAHEDFINEGSVTEAEAVSFCHIINCAQ